MHLIRSYWFWLALLCVAMVIAERVRPWRREQQALRPQISQDVFWLIFNGHIYGIIAASVLGALTLPGIGSFVDVLNTFSRSVGAVGKWPMWAQAIVYLVAADLVEYAVHNALHRVSWLWPIHRVHHSIHTMDWIGNFRFHWGESIVYRSVKFVPLALVGADYEPMLIAWVVSTAVGFLNHSNLNITWGPLRYVLNSPRMHIWHHDKTPPNKVGYNFGIVFSFWDYLFGTARVPGSAPAALGFHRDESYPESLTARFFLPYIRS